MPRAAYSPESFNQMCPVWRLSQIDIDGRWGHSTLDRVTLLQEILPKLKNYESMTWASITADKKRNHSVSVGNLIPDARKRLVELGIDEDRLFRFRLTGQQRVWGIRDRDTFAILWWDPQHEICPSNYADN